MIEKPKVLLVPGYYSSIEKGCMDNYLADARKMLEGIGVEHVETSPLSDLESSRTIASHLRKHECDAVLLYLISWVDTNVVVDLLGSLRDKQIIIWSTDYFDSGGRKSHWGALAGFLPIKGSLEQMGIRCAYLYGNADRKGLAAKLSDSIDAARAVVQIRSSRIGMVGYTALGMFPGMVNPLQVKEWFGTEIIPIDNYALIRLCETMLQDRTLTQQVESFGEKFHFVDPLSAKDERMCVAMTEAIRHLVARHGLSAITVRCCFELATDFGFAPCVPLSILSDECVSSCESDIPVTLSQLILHDLTGKPSPYVDIIMMEDFRIYCSCCGFGAFEYAYRGDQRIAYSDVDEYRTELSFRRVINHSRYQDGVYTLVRMNLPGKGTPHLQAILGENRNDFDAFYEAGCKEYPSMGILVKQETSLLLEKLGSQHFALVEGDVVDKLKYFCKFMGIEMELFS
ncbi:MAG: hypothetical protein V1800_00730 [Candidatus Latescibacterota bacterium]